MGVIKAVKSEARAIVVLTVLTSAAVLILFVAEGTLVKALIYIITAMAVFIQCISQAFWDSVPPDNRRRESVSSKDKLREVLKIAFFVSLLWPLVLAFVIFLLIVVPPTMAMVELLDWIEGKRTSRAKAKV